jgi:hypothetical protein
MKLSEYVVFVALLTPTLVVIVAAVLSFATPQPTPEYPTSIVSASSAGVYPADLKTDE